MKIAIIGGGAAGFFAAIAVKENHPNSAVIIFEKSKKLLAKVKISGGGRCNVTNGTTSITQLSKAYPRGEKKIKKSFSTFNTKHTMEWFESRGVPLVTQADNCVFPVSQNSQSIIDCFLNESRRLNISINIQQPVSKIIPTGNQIQLEFSKEEHQALIFDKVIVATGGSPKRKGLEWLETLGHKIENPVPSLFTFNMPSESVKELMGVVVENVITNIQGTKLKGDGPLLITHWGMSGPAILKLSAFGARILSEYDYKFKVQVNWMNEPNNEIVAESLKEMATQHPKKRITNLKPQVIPQRLWEYFLTKKEIPLDKKWGELGKKYMNKLISVLCNDSYEVQGKTTFKEEFVTCGGVSLESVDINTMQSRVCPNLYFAGEVMDIDAITGGYNFQSAWTTAYIAGKLN